ncbi:enoyl-CoA delta isomerase 1, peroxisomal-like, partial [Mizuhopecten yessoensis]|uniref:enoyl-CoA delta isomerase 1, peroxisomal-like n=1 Tax=Mizuhopecten yessoensis TaxID=6573 RepID=UPI000B45F775
MISPLPSGYVVFRSKGCLYSDSPSDRPMEKRLVTVEFTQDRFAIVRMRNGQNRLNLIFLDSLNQALNEVERNTDCKALITTGEGKFYSNGFDLDWMMSQDSETVVRFDKAIENTMWRVLHFPLPTVAAIN